MMRFVHGSITTPSLLIMADVCLPFQRDEGDGLEKNNTVYSLSA
jgi:hypothetical protein